ncbi:hypothetical protein [Colwellia sp. Bg11-12]|uniref:hypothetical protein n=1 Tax=Colwellia sp. Bg11-12 TaxID=2759817 RepID=UPI0015F730F5|nr:hypothetical protein [Colwellia sp. Bg11-12]MBA6265460.1 hypothetical protein [Colwellia sp. Bg11-12]
MYFFIIYNIFYGALLFYIMSFVEILGHTPDREENYSSASPEYQSNGIYTVKGETFMTVWAHRNYFGLAEVRPEENSRITNEVIHWGARCIKTVPDRGPFKEIYAFQVGIIQHAIERDDGKNNVNKGM